jgi:signal transduction histidine kinase
MNDRPAHKEPLSTALRRNPHGDKEEITRIVRWVGYSALGVCLALLMSNLLLGNYRSVVILSVAIVPMVIALFLLKRNAVSIPSTVLAVTIILLITCLATFGQGIYDIGILGFPVVLIMAGLILRGRVIMYLALLIIACMGWLAFGDLWNLYEPANLPDTHAEDFFIASIVILVAGNAVYRLARNVYHNLARAEQENKMREEAEKQRERIIEQLKRKNQELDRFAIRVSHDLKTPLITLAGFLGYLEKDIKEGNYEKADRDFSQINAAAKAMGKFVDELLDLSRVGRIVNPPADVPFEAIIRDALDATDGLLKARQVQVEVDPIFPFVHVDRARVAQALQNLVTNAVKFMGDRAHPKIRIGFQETEGSHIFFVRDNGIGIPAEHHERIFELFNKLDPNTEGTGIGLGLVKRIVEAHHGKIWVESTPGKGSTFFFTLKQ